MRSRSACRLWSSTGFRVTGIPDAALRERIEADGIDVLVDLSGHTAHNRLGVFARRAAPVQAHYLGYFASTGLTEMDYLIGDEILTPAETDSHFSERVWRLPRIRASYEGKADAPLPAWHPAEDGSVWLGSFNNLGKLTPATLALWAKVLHALPQAKLLLKTKELADAGNRRRILDAMAGHGISPDRIELQDSSVTPGWREHMAYYDRLDIALDPVGAHGGYTTTCDALWMGVPVIALEGDRMATRMTASMLNAIGHPEWIARTEAEYVDKVVALARDVEQRKALRSAQRGRMAASPLCDAQAWPCPWRTPTSKCSIAGSTGNVDRICATTLRRFESAPANQNPLQNEFCNGPRPGSIGEVSPHIETDSQCAASHSDNFTASATPCFCACCSQNVAAALSGAVPRPSIYDRARFTCALPRPASAARLYQAKASFGSAVTPRPVSYISPTLFCAAASPSLAASMK